MNENIHLSYINSKNNEKAVAFLEQMMNILEEYKKLPEVKADVYQNFEYTYSLYNLGLAYFPTIVGYQKAFSCLKKSDAMLRNRDDFKQGAGLGLYVCRLIVTRLGGTIHIDREYTDGTSFVICI